jgi:hypothetical protein
LERIEFLRSMRKRRVGATARSRQNDGNQATGTLQFVTEMAAPLELRTPAGTCGPRLQTECGWKHGDNGAGKSTSRRTIQGAYARKRDETGSGALRALEALPQTPPGGKPPETPAPFPWALILQNGGNLSRVRKPRKIGAPLTDPLRSEDVAEMRERGPCGQGQARAPTGGRMARYARLRLRLKLRQGASPLRPPTFRLTRGGLIMEAATIRSRERIRWRAS